MENVKPIEKAEEIVKNWERYKNPQPLFTLINPAELSEEKIRILAKHIKEDFLNISDEHRSYEVIYAIIRNYFYIYPNCLFYEIGDFGGIIGFINIIPSFKADITMKLWNKELWGKSFVRQMRELLKFVMDELNLRRMNADSPDPRIVRMAKMCGMAVEGMREADFLWEGKPYKVFLLGIAREIKEE